MLKKIPVSQLKIGMYIHDLNSLWFKHPFIFNQFLITEKKQLLELLKSGIKEVTIDTEKGLESYKEPVGDQNQKNEAIDSQLIESKSEITGDISSENISEAIIPLEKELIQAKAVQQDALQFIEQLMNDARLGKQIQLENIDPLIKKIIASIFRNQDALLGLTRIRNVDKYTYEHSLSVAIILTVFAKHLGFRGEELEQICMGGLLIDLGKIKVSQSILKKPGKLTLKEYKLIQNHVIYGISLFEETDIHSDIVYNIMSEHHERLDGSGYPNHKSGDDVSLFGQMAAIVDTYDACVSDHSYKKGKTPNSVLVNFITKSQHHLNQDIMNQFIHCIGIYPIGSMLALSNGYFAVVIESGKEGLLYPKIRIFFDSVRREFMTPEDFQFTTDTQKYSIASVEDPIKWGIKVENYLPHIKV